MKLHLAGQSLVLIHLDRICSDDCDGDVSVGWNNQAALVFFCQIFGDISQIADKQVSHRGF